MKRTEYFQRKASEREREHPFYVCGTENHFVCFSSDPMFLITHTHMHKHDVHKHNVRCLCILRPEQFSRAGLLLPVQLIVGVFQVLP